VVFTVIRGPQKYFFDTNRSILFVFGYFFNCFFCPLQFFLDYDGSVQFSQNVIVFIVTSSPSLPSKGGRCVGTVNSASGSTISVERQTSVNVFVSQECPLESPKMFQVVVNDDLLSPSSRSMEEQQQSNHYFLPGHARGWGLLSLENWINLWIGVVVFSQLGYLFLLGTSQLFVTNTNNRNWRTVSLDVIVIWVLLFLSFAMKFSLDRHNSHSDPLYKLVAFFFVGVLVEVVYYKNGLILKTMGKQLGFPPKRLRMKDLPRISTTALNNRNSTVEASSPQVASSGKRETFLLTWRFAFFLLWSGSNCIITYCIHLRDYDYEYLGPMRITKLPSLHKMPYLFAFDDEYGIFPCLRELPVGARQHVPQPSVQVRLTIEWGERWGCANPEDQDSWNTNWPIYPDCTRFICTTPTINTATEATNQGRGDCPCYPTEEEARNASWECISSRFDLSRIQANETFDRNQAPWEDPLWPSIVRYGSCQRNGGLSMNAEYVRDRMVDGRRQRNYGSVCVSFAFVIICWMRRRSAQQKDETPSHAVSAEALFTRLSALRRENNGTTVYIGEPVHGGENDQIALTEMKGQEDADVVQSTHLLHA